MLDAMGESPILHEDNPPTERLLVELERLAAFAIESQVRIEFHRHRPQLSASARQDTAC
jgi:hypothetical protein